MNVLVYMIKVSLVITAFYVFYQLVFRRLTFFVLNRFYLLGSLVVSIVLPFVNLPAGTVEDPLFASPIMINWDQIAEVTLEGSATSVSGSSSLQILQWILIVYFLVSAFRFFKTVWKYIRTKKFYAGGSIVKEDGIRWNIHPLVASPFTMFRTVYLDSRDYEQPGSPVKLHEEVHARQLHSIDLFTAEIMCAFLWIHPIVFFVRQQIRENHEFLADHVAQERGEGLISYMQAFSENLSRNFDPAFASHFKSSTIKKRIIMMTNKRSQKQMKWYYLLVIPVLAMLVMAFQQPMNMDIEKSGLISIQSAESNPVPVTGEPGIPSVFPLEKKYRDAVTFSYDKRAKHPITGELMTHKGIDFRAPTGAAVYSAADGTVVKSEVHEKYGKYIVINHGKSYATLYAHLSALKVTEGDKVTIGQLIGKVGNTGISTGPHLHYEVRKNGDNVNPAEFY